MRRALSLLLFLSAFVAAQAQTSFRDTPLLTALSALNRGAEGYSVEVQTDGLESLRTTADVAGMPLPDAVRRVCRGLPVRVKRRGRKIYVMSSKKPPVKLAVNGYIRDAFTHEAIDSATVTFMDLDSTVVRRFAVARPYWQYQFQDTLPRAGAYIIKVERRGYNDGWKRKTFRYVPHRLTEGTFDTIYLAKERRVDLPELLVQSTKIKMVVRGDTLVYNADAFNLREGSMLDELIAMLPGATLDRNGVITVNGRRISSLLVGGSDFFRGDPTVALRNLPAYMVDKVKVYEQMSFSDDALGYSREEKRGQMPLVMDVLLKRQYEIGWLGNASVGGGTDSHYAARAFAMRYTKQSRVALYGNANDMAGDAYYDATNGNWHSGRRLTPVKAEQVGLDVSVRDRDGRWQIAGNSKLKNRRTADESSSSTVNFLGETNVFSRERNRSTARQTETNSYVNIEAAPWKGMALKAYGSVDYRYHKNDGTSTSADFDRLPDEHYRGEALDSLLTPHSSDHLIEALRRERLGRGHRLQTNLYLQARQRVGMDLIDVSVGGSFDNDRNQSLSRYSLASQSATYSDYDAKQWNINGAANYFLGFSDIWGWDRMSFQFRYSASHTYTPRHSPFYLLDGTPQEQWPIETLASARDSLARLADVSNSYHSATWHTEQRPFFSFTLLGWTGRKGQTSLFLDFPVRFVSDKADYQRAAIDTTVRASHAFFEPEVRYYYQVNNARGKSDFQLTAGTTGQTADIVQLIGYRDTSTPLVVRMGNPNLRTGRNWQAQVGYNQFRQRSGQSWNASLGYRLYTRMFCQRVSYDASTGTRSYRPDNIDGNWSLSAAGGFNTPLGHRLRLGLSAAAAYRNSADYVSIDGFDSRRSSVRRTTFAPKATLGYQHGSVNVLLLASAGYSHSEANLYETMNLWETQCGLTANIPLPLALRLSSDLRLLGHHGYQDPAFNCHELLWNASLSRTLLRNRLVVTLDAFDILGQLRSVSYTVNAQLQRETWQRTLRRYVMLHLAYRFDAKPKKRR